MWTDETKSRDERALEELDVKTLPGVKLLILVVIPERCLWQDSLVDIGSSAVVCMKEALL